MTRRLTAFAFVVALSGPAAAQTLGTIVTSGQPPRDTRPQTGAGVVRGRVMSDTGQPMRRIVVQLRGAQTPRAAATDIDGRYEFTNLPAGRFFITASHAGFIAPRSDPFDLADGECLDNVNLRMAHGGVITGQIVDEFGEPLVGATVAPLRPQWTNGQRHLVNAGQTTITNDIGEDPSFGPQAGMYYVSVTPRNDSLMFATPMPAGVGGPPNVTATGSPTGYGPTYFPGTPDVPSARPVTIAAAQTVSGISFSLTSVSLAKISGIVVDDRGQPVTRGGVNLTPRGGASIGGIGNTGPLRQDGSFTITNVPPGADHLRATILPSAPVALPSPGMPPTPPQVAIAAVTVTGDDITGVVLVPVKPAIVRGRVTFDDPGAAASIKASTVRVTASRVDTSGPPLVNGPPGGATASDDFSFELSTSPELTNLRAIVPAVRTGGAAPWRIRSVFVRGQDVTDTGVELQPGVVLEDVEIAMTTQAQTISGTVTDTDGAPAKTAMVLTFSVDRDRWVTASGRYRASVGIGQDGTFKVMSLPPGSYYALAVPTNVSPAPDWNDPDVLEGAARTATRISVGEGSSVTVDLKLSR